MATKEKMVPFGSLNLDNDEFDVFYGLSFKTSDFLCDALEWCSPEYNLFRSGVDKKPCL